MVHTVMGWIDNGEEPDWEERERATKCPACGAFIPSHPTFEGGELPVGNDVAWVDGVLTVVEVTDFFEPTTDCKRCGRIWRETDLWR